MDELITARPPITRRRVLIASGIGLVGVTGLAVEGMLLEPRRLEVTRHTLGTPDAERRPLRLAVLTDLHLKRISDFHAQIVDAVREAEPAAVLFVGDSIDRADNLPLLSEFLRLLPPSGMRIATLGNWEHWSRVDLDALGQAYEREDTRLVVNEGLELAAGAWLYGTDDALAGSPNLEGLSDDPQIPRRSCSATLRSSGTR